MKGTTKLITLSLAMLPLACDVTVHDHHDEPDPWHDSDRDGLTDHEEVYDIGTDPYDYDTDHDGLGDGAEWDIYRTDPLDWDTDGDGYSDGDEVAHGEDPLHWGY